MVHLYARRRIVDRAGAARVVAGNNDLARLPARPIASHSCAGRRAAAGRLVVVFRRAPKTAVARATRCPIAVNELHASNIGRVADRARVPYSGPQQYAVPIARGKDSEARAEVQLFGKRVWASQRPSDYCRLGVGSLRRWHSRPVGINSVGHIVDFCGLCAQMQGATGGLIDIFTKLKAAQASVERLLEVLHAEDTIREVPNPRPLKISNSKSTRIEFDNVTFGYDAGRAVLQNVSLTAEPGQMIALVGPTGAGKSTLVSLIPRFFDPWHGRVILDGIDVRELELASLRDAISIVLQEPFLLPLTIAENIAYSRPDATRDEIIAAAIAARADSFISRLPEGYDTPVGEAGSTLSVGEQQRIAIARALLKDAPYINPRRTNFCIGCAYGIVVARGS